MGEKKIGLIHDRVGEKRSLMGVRDDVGARKDERDGEKFWRLARLMLDYLPGFASNFETGMNGRKVLQIGEIGVGEK